MTTIAQILAFQLDNRFYGIHLSQVQRIIRSVDFIPLPGSPEIVLGIIDVGGEIAPLLNTRKRLGLENRDLGINDQIIIARTTRRLVALLVDGVMGVIERPATDIIAAEKIIPHSEPIEGVIQLNDGLMLINDLERFLSLDDEQILEDALTEQSRHGSPHIG